MTTDDIRELEEHRADFRALRDRVDRLSSMHPVTAAMPEFALEVQDAETEVDGWERALGSAREGIVIVVTGGRGYQDRAAVYRTLDRVHAARTVRLLVQGGAPGADELAKDWAVARGVAWESEPARWDDIERPGAVVRRTRNGKPYDAAAGRIRNGVMLDKYRPHGVVAFPGGTGTADCCTQAKARGVKVWRPRV